MSNNSQSNHRHLRRKCNWMTLTRVLCGSCASLYSLKQVLSTLDNILIELKQSIGYTGSKGSLRKDLLHMKFTYTRCGVNRKVLMERQDVVLLRRVRELRETGFTVAYTDETLVHTSHAFPKCWKDSTTGIKIPFSKVI